MVWIQFNVVHCLHKTLDTSLRLWSFFDDLSRVNTSAWQVDWSDHNCFEHAQCRHSLFSIVLITFKTNISRFLVLYISYLLSGNNIWQWKLWLVNRKTQLLSELIPGIEWKASVVGMAIYDYRGRCSTSEADQPRVVAIFVWFYLGFSVLNQNACAFQWAGKGGGKDCNVYLVSCWKWMNGYMMQMFRANIVVWILEDGWIVIITFLLPREQFNETLPRIFI